MLRIYLYFILCFGWANSFFAQQEGIPPCALDQVQERLQYIYPTHQQELEDLYQLTERVSKETSSSNRNIIRIPVVVHIIHTGQPIGAAPNIPVTRITQQLEILNKDYRRQNADANQTPDAFIDLAADMQIEFVLATHDPNGQPTSAITRHGYGSVSSIDYIEDIIKPETIWDPKRYLNIWTVPMPNQNILGYSYLPTSTILNSDLDGLVINHVKFGITSISQGRTATHEIGHYLGLQHPWGSQEGNCSVDDGIADTPSKEFPHYDCPFHPRFSCGSTDMFMNYMDYVDDNCMNLFTEGQANVMRNTLNNLRPQLRATLTSTTDVFSSVDMDIYPNPASEMVNIQLNGQEKLRSIRLIDIQGKEVAIYTQINQTSFRLPVQQFSSGIYYLKIAHTEGIQIEKIILH